MNHPQLIDRRYQVLSPLGSGLSGEIYKVQGPEGVAALKLLKREIPGLNAEEAIAHFKFEFSLLKGLAHPHIVQIFDFGFDEQLKRFYFTQELVEGAPLEELGKKTSLSQIQELFLQALQGLAYLHGHDIIHGDLKPDNLLVTRGPSISPLLKIIDFGISHPRLVGIGGTPAYMAPEKILKEPMDARSDLYSLATVFYGILTGENPFLRKNVLATLQAHLKFTPPSATTLRPEIDPVWSELLGLMLKKNPRQRISSAEACLQFLETRGESPLPLKRPRLLPRVWIGRPEILESAKSFLRSLAVKGGTHPLLLIGEKGLGVESLLTELKYEAELLGVEVLGPQDTPQRKPAVFFIPPDATRGTEKNSPKLRREASLLAALEPEQEAEWSKALGMRAAPQLRLRPLTREETELFLREVTRNEIIPLPFLNALYRISRGYPAALQEALEHLLKDPLIVDNSGRWHLAVFAEVEPRLEQLGFSERTLEQALEGDTLADPQERWQVRVRRAEALAKRNALDDALAVLAQLESELAQTYPRPRRLVERSRLLEKRGWIYTKQNRYQEAREDYASAISLLRETEQPEPVLELRLKNFLAYLDLQEGRIPEAIAQFEANSRDAENLSEAQRRGITNNELGSAYLAAGKIEEAIVWLKEDLNFFSGLSDPVLLMKTNYNLGEASTKTKDFVMAKQAFERVAETARRERDWDYLIRAYNGLGNAASLQKHYPESLDYYQRSLALSEYLQDYACAATVAQNRGVILNETGRLEEALHDLEVSKKLISKIHPSSHTRYLMARATLELGEVYRKKKDYALAKNYFTEALNRSEEDPNLKGFRFYPLASLAKLALDSGDQDTFRELYPKLVHLAVGEEEKETLGQLMAEVHAEAKPGKQATVLAFPPAARRSTLSLPGPFPEQALLSILKINRALLTEHRPEDLFKKILQYATELSGAESALLLEVAEDGSFEVREAFNTQVDEGQKEISQQIAQRVLSSGESIVTRDALLDENFNQFASVLSLNLRSIACIPIRLHQKVVGLLYLTHRYRSDVFQPETVAVLEAFGDQAGLALQNARYLGQVKSLNRELKGQLENAEEEIDRLKSDLRLKVKNPYPKILGKSRGIVEILKLMDRISDTNLGVLILGETGSGKELVARSLHEHSRRRAASFIAVNCGAIPENLIESELFGYRAGAFTGATRDKRGLLEEAHGGTLFLDEIAELPLNTQVKLLRALQEKEIRRVGDTKTIPLDMRILSATHRTLEDWVKEGKFREDLYYRVAQMALVVPPLRERREDIPLLCEHFLKESAKENEQDKVPQLAKDLLELLMNYDWPGNVRELENVLRTASAFAERGRIHRGHLPAFLLTKLTAKKTGLVPRIAERLLPSQEVSRSTPASPGNLYQPDWKWDQYEEAVFAKNLLQHEMNCEKVAEALGVGVATVYVKMRKYGLKNNTGRWEAIQVIGSSGATLEEIKQRVIEETYRRNDQSPYLTAKQLGLNVGTIYRHLKARPHPSIR